MVFVLLVVIPVIRKPAENIVTPPVRDNNQNIGGDESNNAIRTITFDQGI